MELALPFALAPMVVGGGAMLAAGAIWCLVYPRVQNEIGLEIGKWKATGLPTGVILIAAGVGLLYLGSRKEKESPAKPEIWKSPSPPRKANLPSKRTSSCPFTVNLMGRISVTGGEGEIAYRFVRQSFNGPEEPSEIRNLRVDEPGSYSARGTATPSTCRRGSSTSKTGSKW